MALTSENLKIGRERIIQIFHYLEALNQLCNPVKRLVSEQPWTLWLRDLPDHPSVCIGIFNEVVANGNEQEDSTEANGSIKVDDFILKVSRPTLTIAPAPPSEIADWLHPSWADVDQGIKVYPSRNAVDKQSQTTVVKFEDDPRRPELLRRWQEKREQWAQNEKPARRAYNLFERLFDLHSQIKREAERVELVLGDGILNWRRPEGGIHHPVLLQRLQLEFDPDIPEFTLRETEYSVELYSALFRAMPDIDGQAIGKYREDLEQGPYHPLGGEATSSFLRRLVRQLSPHGEFIKEGQLRGESDFPRLTRDPVIFLRNRTLGFATALEAILKDLPDRENLSSPLLNIIGIETPPPDESNAGNTKWSAGGNEDEHILFSKPANLEQLQIAQRLDKYGCVLVQGPPGTGKTHTIANLIGHLLARGKTILVTSHAAKALRVLREQVVPELQSLCVSVLESDTESREQLKSSVNAIVERLASLDADHMESKARSLDQRRLEILTRLNRTRNKLQSARADEYRDIVMAGESYSPSNAARKVAEGRAKEDWIPSSIIPGAPLPLSVGELINLYRTNATVTPEDERELAAILPLPKDLLAPPEFEQLVGDHKRLAGENLGFRQDLWQQHSQEFLVACSKCGVRNRITPDLVQRKPVCGKCKEYLPSPVTMSASDSDGANADSLTALLNRLIKSVEVLQDGGDRWKLAAIASGIRAGIHREPWDNLIALITNLINEASRAEETFLRYGPSLTKEGSLEDEISILAEIIQHLENGGNLNKWALLLHPKWARVIAASSVNGSKPRSLEHFHALRTIAHLNLSRQGLVERWSRMMVPLGGPNVNELGDRPEWACAQYVQLITNCLEWHAKTWTPLQEELARQELLWQVLLQEMPPNLAPNGDLLRVRDAVLNCLPKILAAQINRIRWNQAEQIFTKQARLLACTEDDSKSAQVVYRLREAVAQRDSAAYRLAYERLTELHNRSTELARRRELLLRLEGSAPAWAGVIRNRQSPHSEQDMPGDPVTAWLWRQLHDELESRSRTSIGQLHKDVENLTNELQRATAELINCRAWAAQIRRTGLRQRQALEGYRQAIRRIGRGTGKRAPRLMAEARKLMDECRTAVPVWIMPLARVVENFNPNTTRFDAVIIDEASQSDVMGLIAFHMAKQVVVVGDDEQVSPEAVGQRLDDVQYLIDENLQGIPNANLYDGKMSIYDLAGASFGGRICLREHFRCVPEIIQFSNYLSYEGKIRPLRDASSVQLKPYVIPYRVDGASSKNKVNEPEALALASLLIAATEQPEYADKTFGVISLLGEKDVKQNKHAAMIDKLLRTYLLPTEYERRRIVCGNAAHFQGDERDVMFLSVVDAPVDGPLSLRDQPMFKKRFNVAASRARDQMWVVHSLNPEIDLKPGDLRRRLIEYAQNPSSLMQLLEQQEKQTESEFERLVLRCLVSASYRVIPQWKVGHYRIDMVVEGDGKRLAIECDGDRYHPLEKLPEDMARQAILERLGWKFVRIRGSEFFRDPERAMQPVFMRLNAIGIQPQGESSDNILGNDQETELKDRIIRRAEELRKRWSEASSLEIISSVDQSSTVSNAPHNLHYGELSRSQLKTSQQQKKLFDVSLIGNLFQDNEDGS